MTEKQRPRTSFLKSVPWNTASFLLATDDLRQLPPDTGAEIACAGRSNAGKSSALNAITGMSALARVSKTPGCTRQLIVFTFDEARRLVDLPGYGYAKVSLDLRKRWGLVLTRYFETRASLRGLLLAMDARHPMTPFDLLMLELATQVGLPCHVLLTKSDKLSRPQAQASLQGLQRALGELSPHFSSQLFSSPKRLGVDDARRVIAGWLA